MLKLSPRERKIAIGVLVVVGIWALDELAIAPLLAQQSQLRDDNLAATQQLQQATHLFAVARKDQRTLSQMTHAGLGADASAAESQMLHSIGDWARESGLTLTGNKPDRAEPQKPFEKIIFHVTSTGNMNAVNQFLWHVQTATIPARVEEMTVASRKDGTDEVSLSVAISTLCMVPPPSTAPGVKETQ